ncbi:hypothetical protein TNCV_3912841 [Trichonephila clavipes]|nr:hypothetical protein TNCV_3912841 [Trichonephila clavipes]
MPSVAWSTPTLLEECQMFRNALDRMISRDSVCMAITSESTPNDRYLLTLFQKIILQLRELEKRFYGARIKDRATDRNTPEMHRALFKVPSMRTKVDRDVYPIAPHTITPCDGPI